MRTIQVGALRVEIAKNVRILRKQRNLSQADLSMLLGMSQGRYSEIERGLGSFSAEQFVGILKVFNVTVGQLVPEKADHEAQLHNALARLGASHLAEDSRLLPSEQLGDVESVVREVLIAGEPARQITALAPVMIRNIERLNLARLWTEFQGYGMERRLVWLVDSTHEAIRVVVGDSVSDRLLHKSMAAFQLFLRREGPRRLQRAPGSPAAPTLEEIMDVDVLGPPTLSEKTLRNIIKKSSIVARRWGVATSIQTEDFVEAVRASR